MSIERFGVSVQASQLLLFLFLGAFAVGVLVGGPIGDRIGRKRVIWFSILGVLPFTLALPYANLLGTAVLTVIIGLILASASSAILVYAQELLPGRVGLVAGVFFGFAFGLGGLGAALLGELVDHTSLDFVYQPLLGAAGARPVRRLPAGPAARAAGLTGCYSAHIEPVEHVVAREVRVRPRDRRVAEPHHLAIRLRPVCRPLRQAGSVRIAGLGEVGPVG